MISPDIITNNHVIEGASEIHVLFSDKTNVPAKLVGRDPATDIAVLKIDPRSGMSVISWGNSDIMQPGAWTIAIGSPFGLGGTVTVGVLSARSRDIQLDRMTIFYRPMRPLTKATRAGLYLMQRAK